MAGKNTYKKRITPGVYFEDNNLNDLGKGVNNNKYNATRKLIEEGYLVDEFFGDILLSEDNKIIERETLIETTETTTAPPVTTTTTTVAPTTTTTTTEAPATSNIKYGRLYNWYAATDSRGVAPEGWHVATIDDYLMLNTSLGSLETNNNYIPTFNLTYSGILSNDNLFYGLEPNGSYLDGAMAWFITPNVPSDNPSLFVLANIYTVVQAFNHSKIPTGLAGESIGCSIRLVKDNSINEGDITIDGDIYNTVKIGDQVWLKQNLAVRHYQNGDLIGSDFTGTVGAVIAYENNEANVYSNLIS